MLKTYARRILGHVTILLVFAAATGCMFQPYDGQEIEDRGATLQFAGATRAPNQEIKLRQHRVDRDFIYGIETMRTSTTISRDVAGAAWYPWAVQTYLESAPWFWRKGGSGTRRHIETMVSAYNNSEVTGLYTFDSTKADCINEYYYGSGGVAALAYCSDAETKAILKIPCGRADQRCCVAYDFPAEVATADAPRPCNAGLGCLNDRCVADPYFRQPIASAELDVTFCAGSSRPSYIETNWRKGKEMTEGGGGLDYWQLVNAAERNTKLLKPLTSASTFRFALDTRRIPTLGSIPGLSLRMPVEKCVEAVALRINGREVFRDDHRFNYEKEISDGKLAAQWNGVAENLMCRPPTSIAGSTVKNIVQTEVGQAMVTSSELTSATVTTTNISDSTHQKIQSDIRLRVDVGTEFNCTADVTVRLRTQFECTMQGTSGVIAGNPIDFATNKPVRSVDPLTGREVFIQVRDVEVNGVFCDIAAEVLDFFGIYDKWNEANQRVKGLAGKLADELRFESRVPICPTVTVSGSAGTTTPGLSLNWGVFGATNTCAAVPTAP